MIVSYSDFFGKTISEDERRIKSELSEEHESAQKEHNTQGKEKKESLSGKSQRAMSEKGSTSDKRKRATKEKKQISLISREKHVKLALFANRRIYVLTY